MSATLHVAVVAEVHPLHAENMFVPEVVGASRLTDVPALKLTLNGVVPVCAVLELPAV